MVEVRFVRLDKKVDIVRALGRKKGVLVKYMLLQLVFGCFIAEVSGV